MNNKILSEYAKLEAEYRAFEAKREAMRAEIVALFREKKIDKIEDPDLGLFTIGRRTSWEYTEGVKKIEERLKIAKTKEQQKGLAKAKESEYLLYKEPKQTI